MEKYLKSFIIGSSYPVIILPFYIVSRLNSKKINYTYKSYTFIAPLYIGIMNALSLYIMSVFSLSMENRYYLISIISAIIVATFATHAQAYNYNRREWALYYMRLFILHFILYNVIIYSIEKIIG